MSTPAETKPRLWPRFAVSPEGQRARVDCLGDIPPDWVLETPLPGTAPEPDIVAVRAEYRDKLGKAPFNGWNIATLRKKIDEAPAPEAAEPEAAGK